MTPLTHESLAPPVRTVLLEGTPPFQLQLSIRNLAASKVRIESVTINEKI